MARLSGRLLVGVATAGVIAAGIAPQTTAAELATITDTQRLGPGVTLSTFSTSNGQATVTGELISVDLGNSHVSVDLLHPPVVAQREEITEMAADAHAVAGVNADFFNISEAQHPGVPPTNSSSGPEVTDFRALKGAVPNAQRFGPGLAPGTSTRDVIGVDRDGRARLNSLHLRGRVTTDDHRWPLRGYNQYALPEDSIGVFTSEWGSVSRARAVCGSDERRSDPCSDEAAEVTVRNGKVISIADAPGEGSIPSDTSVLVGREAGAKKLRTLEVGDAVTLKYELVGEGRVRMRFAVGGAPILRDGATLPGVDADVKATRTGAGISPDGKHLYLVTLDGRSEAGGGLTLAQLSALLISFGADDGMNIDGGGSTTCAARLPGSHKVTLCNDLPDGVAERPVANGIGVFVD